MQSDDLLRRISVMLGGDLQAATVVEILSLLGAPGFPPELLDGPFLYSDHLPRADEVRPTQHQRCLHFLWDAIDKIPAGIVSLVAIPLRRMIAGRLFARCGSGFIADEHVRFNFGQLLEVGDEVFINRGTYLDSKGGIRIGNRVGIAEDVTIFTHTHSESDHAERAYAPVTIEDDAKVYAGAMLLPGVTIGREAIVAGRALVSHDVEPGMVVAGQPSHPLRPRRSEGRSGMELHHLWLNNGAFQR